MSQAAETSGIPAPTLAEQIRLTWAVAAYELRRLLRAKHGLVRLFILLLPFFFALLVATVRMLVSEAVPSGRQAFGSTFTVTDDLTALARSFRIGYLRWIVFLTIAGLFGGLYSGERSERTLHHVFLQPLRRGILTFGKYFGAVLLLWITAVVAWLMTTFTWLLPHGIGAALGAMFSARGLSDLAAYALILLLACLAYGGVFTLAGAVFRSPPIVALALLAWEGLCSILPVSFQRFTVFYWLDSLLPTRVPASNVLAVLAEPAPWPACVLVCVVVGGVGVTLASWRARRMELAYGASE